MKIQRTRKQRICSNPKCKKTILKGQKYTKKIQTISDPLGQSLNGGETWTSYQMTVERIFCLECAK